MCRRHVRCSGPSALLITLVGVVCAAAVEAQILYVDDDALPGGDGLSWDTPFKYLQDALYTAADDPGITEIRVAQGIYKPDADEAGNVTPGDRAATFQLISGLALRGGYAGITEPDPDARDIKLYKTTLSGDLAGNDGPDFENNDENSNHVVTGSNTDQTAVLDGFTITGGNADGNYLYGRGAGMFSDKGNSNVTSCTFAANSAAYFGGGAYLIHGMSTLSDCVFTANTARSGGGIDSSRNWPTLTGCTFDGNTVERRGAGMYLGFSNATLEGCVFRLGSAGYEGGGIFNAGGDPTLSNCRFTANATDGSGAGIYSQSGAPTLTACTFDANVAEKYGGAMYIYGSRSVLTGCTFSRNVANDSAGALYCNASLDVVDCMFNENFAVRDGGALVIYSYYYYPELVNCTFIDNFAVDNGGGIYVVDGRPEFVGCTLSGNFAGDCGGGIYGYGTLTECTLLSNSANDAGGGMYGAPGSSSTVLNCTFEANDADNGGGLAVAEGAAATVANCAFTRNDAADFGGGIYADRADRLDVTYCAFIFNNGGDYGGGIYASACSPTVADCLFSANSAASGGGMANFDNSPLITDSVFAMNWLSDGWGGGMYNDGASPTVIGCAFVGNYASASNDTGQGGGIASAWDSNPTIINCLFAGNYSDGSSSAVGAFWGGSTVVVNCTVSANTGGSGGAIYSVAADMTLADSIVWGNWPPQIRGPVAVTYSCVEGGWDGEGNIDADPLLAGGPTGTWTSDASHNADTYQVEFTDQDASWSENEWVGAYVNPDTSVFGRPRQFVIVANTPTTITAWADRGGASWVDAGDPYQLYDYHLNSNSPCIDAGDNSAVPADEFDLDEDGDTKEPLPFDLDGNPRFVDDPATPDTGKGAPPIVDMGAYEFQACPGDLDDDRDVDQSDLGIFLPDWGCAGGDCIGDIDGDGDTDADDLQLLLANWGASCP